MRGLKFTIGLLAGAVFLGGCIIEPLDPESEEEDLGSVTEGVSAAPSPATQTGGTPTTSPMIDGVISNRSAEGSGNSEPAKPQPDPWTGGIRRADGSTTTTATTPAP